jgi:hypothetical protein
MEITYMKNIICFTISFFCITFMSNFIQAQTSAKVINPVVVPEASQPRSTHQVQPASRTVEPKDEHLKSVSTIRQPAVSLNLGSTVSPAARKPLFISGESVKKESENRQK